MNFSSKSNLYYIKKISDYFNTLWLFCVYIYEIHASKIVMEVADLFFIIINC